MTINFHYEILVLLQEDAEEAEEAVQDIDIDNEFLFRTTEHRQHK